VATRNRRATDPYGRWCGGRELESPAYPIGLVFFDDLSKPIVASRLAAVEAENITHQILHNLVKVHPDFIISRSLIGASYFRISTYLISP